MKNAKPEVGIILLAAGSSARMGQNKLMLVYKGLTLMERALRAAENCSADHVVIVTGSNGRDHKVEIAGHNVMQVFNEEWEKGIGSSLKCGLKQLMKTHKETEAVIISVCDQPYLTSIIFDGLIETYHQTGKKIVASAYGGTIGVPVLYDKVFFDNLMNIPDDQGAKQHLLENISDEIITSIPFQNGEVDIDTREDLIKIE